MDRCMQEVFRLVGNLAGITDEEVGQLDLDVFAAMIVRIPAYQFLKYLSLFHS